MTVRAVRDGKVSAGAVRLQPKLARQFSSVEAQLLTTFASRLLDRAGSAYAEGLDDDALFASVLSAFAFFTAAGPLPRVRVFNPRRANHGWDSSSTIVEVCSEDGPFILATVRGALRRGGFGVRHLLHPVYVVRRERDGGLTGLADRGDDGERECLLHIVLDEVPDASAVTAIESALRDRLGHIGLATRDQRAMHGRLEALAQDLEWVAARSALRSRDAELHETVAFLRWLAAGNFTFLGFEEGRIGPSGEGDAGAPPDAGTPRLGLLRATSAPAAPPTAASPATAQEMGAAGSLIAIAGAAVESPVHPFTPMDWIAVQRLAPDGRVVGEARFLGLFTAKAHAQESGEIPVLRRMLAEILAAEEAWPGSHDARELVALFNGFPRSELFGASPRDILEDMRGILAARPDEVTVASRALRAPGGGQELSILVSVPAETLPPAATERIRTLLAVRAEGCIARVAVAQSEGQRARLYVVITGARNPGGVGGEACRGEIAQLLDPWREALHRELETRWSATDAAQLMGRLAGAFPGDGGVGPDVGAAADHIDAILELERTRSPQVRVSGAGRGGNGPVRVEVRVYDLETDPALGVVIRILEHLGLDVCAEGRLVVALPEGPRIVVSTLLVGDAAGVPPLPVDELCVRLQTVLTAVERGEVEDDTLNRLVLGARLDVAVVDRLRLLVRAGCHVGVAAARAAGDRALVRHGEAAAALYAVFQARFASASPADVGNARERLRERVDELVEASDRDIFRRLGELVDAIARTNVFRLEEERHDHPVIPPRLAITIDPARLPWVVGDPHLGLETYVQNTHMEGLFIRSAGMARGRILQQDAPEGLRSLLLERLGSDGLRHAATASEAAAGAIAPKGGAWQSEEGRRVATAALLHGLIDLADNRPGAEHEPRIYARDHDLLGVVAEEDAAAFADLANQIATGRGFWLGDAFAPGGARGYDPADLGIAGRGAWECVRAHLREAGRVVEDSVVVIGAGDMTDPFFRAGMLASPTIQLRAALSPRYLFLDPDPDPGEALAERRRLAEGRLGWESYDVSKLSRGGMVLARTAKRVPVSPEVRVLLGLPDQGEEVSGEGLARAILQARADVLWTGGAEVAEQALGGTAGPADASGTSLALRAAVVAEGSASGFTPEARVDYARGGGRINSFALDSTADVDLGDHEVVLKLLLKPLVDAGTLDASERDGMLRELGDDVVARVLARIRTRHRALSLDQRRAGERPVEHGRAFAWLAATDGRRGPRATGDPAASRTTVLTRPELSLLVARAKRLLKRTLLDDRRLIDDPSSEAFLFHYFPVRVRQQFSGEIRSHPLRREIVGSELANTLVDLMGATFVYRLARDADADVAAVARAWAIAFALADTRELMQSVAAHEIAEPAGQATLQEAAHGAVGATLEALSRWVLANVPSGLAPSQVIGELVDKLREIGGELPACFAAGDAEAFQRRLTQLEMAGLVPMLARQLAIGVWIPGVLDAIRIGAELGIPWERVARVRSGVHTWLALQWLEAQIDACEGAEEWQHAAVLGLREDLASAWRAIVRRLCAAGAVTAAADAPGLPRERAEKVLGLIGELRAAPTVGLTTLHVVVREMRKLAEG